MTTGTTGTPSAPSAGFSGFRSYSTWAGADGKYEMYNGSIRSKWNSYSATKCRLQSFDGKVGFRCPLGHTEEYGVPFNYYLNSSNGSTLPTFSSNDRNEMLAKLLERVKGHSFNMAVNLAQTGQVADMVVSNLGKLGRSVMALKHGDFATAARQLGASPKPSRLKSTDISGRWLELQYGWLPTLSDTFEACKAFEAISNGPSKSRFSVKRSQTGTQTINGTTSAEKQRLGQKRTLTYTLELAEELSFARQLGLTDPLSVAWELIPYSFVVDWFVPIGTYLSNLSQIPVLKGRWMVTECKSTTGVTGFRTTAPLPYCGAHPSKQYTGITHYANAKYSCEEITRTALSSPPTVPAPRVELSGAVHGKRVWNAIALAAQRFLR